MIDIKTRVKLVLSLWVFTVIFGCVDNEQSFYVEHMKAPPDPPECTVSIGDKATPAVVLNLMTAYAPGSFFQATNSLIAREDYGNLRAESNGIMIDGYELYTYIPGGGVVNGTEYFDYNNYMPPETTELVYAQFMSTTVTERLRTTYSCLPPDPEELARAILFSNIQRQLDSLNPAPSAGYQNWLNQQVTARQDILDNLVDFVPVPEVIYSSVRFLGHSQAGKEVETPEFMVTVYPYCEILGGWASCKYDPCKAFCSDEASYPEVCSPGVGDAMTCSDYLSSFKNMLMQDPQTEEMIDACEWFNCGG